MSHSSVFHTGPSHLATLGSSASGSLPIKRRSLRAQCSRALADDTSLRLQFVKGLQLTPRERWENPAERSVLPAISSTWPPVLAAQHRHRSSIVVVSDAECVASGSNFDVERIRPRGRTRSLSSKFVRCITRAANQQRRRATARWPRVVFHQDRRLYPRRAIRWTEKNMGGFIPYCVWHFWWNDYLVMPWPWVTSHSTAFQATPATNLRMRRVTPRGPMSGGEHRRTEGSSV